MKDLMILLSYICAGKNSLLLTYKVTLYTTPLKAERQYNTLPQMVQHTRVIMCKHSVLKATLNEVHQLKHIHQYSYKQRENIFYFVKLKYYPKKTIPPASDYFNLEVASTTTQAAKHRTLTLQ